MKLSRKKYILKTIFYSILLQIMPLKDDRLLKRYIKQYTEVNSIYNDKQVSLLNACNDAKVSITTYYKICKYLDILRGLRVKFC